MDGTSPGAALWAILSWVFRWNLRAPYSRVHGELVFLLSPVGEGDRQGRGERDRSPPSPSPASPWVRASSGAASLVRENMIFSEEKVQARS